MAANDAADAEQPPADIHFDLGNLAASATGIIDVKAYKKGGEKFLLQRAQEHTQSLVHKLFECPFGGRPAKDAGRLINLPDTTTALPREKPIPVDKPQTKWEKFAEKKGIMKKKRSRMVLDEETGQYLPRYGYKSVDKDGLEAPFIEHKEGMDLTVDPWSKLAEEKRERVAKNKHQEVGNRRRAMKDSVATMGATVGELSLGQKEKTKPQVEAAYDIARGSTASIGKFDAKRKEEPRIRMGKRQFDPVAAPTAKAAKAAGGAEQKSNLRLLGRLLGKEGSGNAVLNQTKAVKSVHDSVGRDDAQAARLDKRSERALRKMVKKKIVKKSGAGKFKR